jgi:hypothetical protein
MFKIVTILMICVLNILGAAIAATPVIQKELKMSSCDGL